MLHAKFDSASNGTIHSWITQRRSLNSFRKLGQWGYVSGKSWPDSPKHLCCSSNVFWWMQNPILHRMLFLLTQQVDDFTASLDENRAFLCILHIILRPIPPFDCARALDSCASCRIEFCIQHNTLEEQHTWLGASRHDILLEHPLWTCFRELLRFYRSVIQLRMVPLDAESNSASSTVH